MTPDPHALTADALLAGCRIRGYIPPPTMGDEINARLQAAALYAIASALERVAEAIREARR